MLRTVQFQCLNCGALYQVLKCEAGPETDDRQITCRACGAPLVGPMKEIGGHVPFALATRPAKITLPPWTKYSAALSDYMRRHGLSADP